MFTLDAGCENFAMNFGKALHHWFQYTAPDSFFAEQLTQDLVTEIFQ